MKKIEEVAAILIEEISDFKDLVSRLEVLLDIKQSSSMEEEILNLKPMLIKSLENQNRFQEGLNIKFKESKYQPTSLRTPKWLLAILSVTSILAALLISYSIYQIKSIPDIQNQYFQKGQEEAINHFKHFFDEHKSAADSYDNWIDTKK
jgi:hypothetical protein